MAFRYSRMGMPSRGSSGCGVSCERSTGPRGACEATSGTSGFWVVSSDKVFTGSEKSDVQGLIRRGRTCSLPEVQRGTPRETRGEARRNALQYNDLSRKWNRVHGATEVAASPLQRHTVRLRGHQPCAARVPGPGLQD